MFHDGPLGRNRIQSDRIRLSPFPLIAAVRCCTAPWIWAMRRAASTSGLRTLQHSLPRPLSPSSRTLWTPSTCPTCAQLSSPHQVRPHTHSQSALYIVLEIAVSAVFLLISRLIYENRLSPDIESSCRSGKRKSIHHVDTSTRCISMPCFNTPCISTLSSHGPQAGTHGQHWPRPARLSQRTALCRLRRQQHVRNAAAAALHTPHAPGRCPTLGRPNPAQPVRRQRLRAMCRPAAAAVAAVAGCADVGAGAYFTAYGCCVAAARGCRRGVGVGKGVGHEVQGCRWTGWGEG